MKGVVGEVASGHGDEDYQAGVEWFVCWREKLVKVPDMYVGLFGWWNVKESGWRTSMWAESGSYSDR